VRGGQIHKAQTTRCQPERLVQERDEEVIDGGAEEGCAGDGEDPGPDDVARDAPAHGGEAVRSANAHDGAGDGVGGADRNAKTRGGKQGNRTGRLRGKPAEGSELVMRWPMVLMMRQPPAIVPPPMARQQQIITQ